MKQILSILTIGILTIVVDPVISSPRIATSPRSATMQNASPSNAPVTFDDVAPAGNLMALAGTAPASKTNRSWDMLENRIKIGREVIVTNRDSTQVRGRLLAIDALGITVQQPGEPLAIAVANVRRVEYAGTRKRNVIKGMLIGMAGGAIATMIIDNQSAHPSTKAEAGGMGALFIGLPIGTVVGALVPTGQPLYEADDASILKNF